MTVRELIDVLETMPYDSPVVVNSTEVTEVLIRHEIFYNEDYLYKEWTIVKLY